MLQPPGIMEVIDENRLLCDISPESHHDQELKDEMSHFPSSYNVWLSVYRVD